MRHRHDAPADIEPMSAEARAWYRARRQVRALRGWYLHLAIYTAVNALLWLRFALLPDFGWHGPYFAYGWPWPLGTTLWWGLGLTIHGLVVWSRISNLGRDWEERKIREFMSRP